MKKKSKFYVVWEGNKTGIFTTWNDCKVATNGYPKAKFKSFENRETAEEAFSRNYYDYAGKTIHESSLTPSELKLIGKPILNSISVDAACSGNPGRMEYRGVLTENKKEIFINGPFEESTNNIGEFLAIVHGLAILKQKNLDIPLYSDSKIAINWVKVKKCRTNLEHTKKNKIVFDLIERAENWLKNNSYTSKILKWETKAWGEIPADFGRK